MSHTPFRRAVAAALMALLVAPALPARAAGPEITLKQIMADPDWIGNPPSDAYWADDGQSVYYRQKRVGSDVRDLYRLRLAGSAEKGEKVPPEKKSAADADGEVSRDRTLKVYERSGDIFVKDLKTGAIRQITRTNVAESSPHFLWGARKVYYQADNAFFIHDLDSGLTTQAAAVELTKDPAVEEAKSFLEEQQQRLFDVLRKRKDRADARRKEEREEQRTDPARPALPFYLGDKVEIITASLSPRGDRLLVVTRPKQEGERKRDVMARFVTDSGYVEADRVRTKVGDPKDTDTVAQQAILLDLTGHRQLPLDFSTLPGVADDPLKELREKAEARRKEKEAAAKKAAEAATGQPAKPEAAGEAGKKDDEKKDEGKKDEAKKASPRPILVQDLSWADDGSRVALRLESTDNKDRWLATVDLDKGTLTTRHRLSDPAWVSWDLNFFGWLRDNATLYYLSEETGYSNLFLVSDTDGARRTLVGGKFEVSRLSRDRGGRFLYYIANAKHPGNHELYRVEVASGKSEALTNLGGEVSDFDLSLDESKLVATASTMLHPNELFLVDNRAGATARQLTQSVTPAFAAIEWSRPEVVPIPSSHGAFGIYTRVYTPPGFDPQRAEKYPGVIFIHGAGYAQNAHLGWASYFREFMFHTFLTRHGYVVIDQDYRASAGYGRDWRTAIYRQMGYPEVEDLEDGVSWMVANRNVDPKRVGAYGGSYGGFLTLMALFRKPDLFAAGAALRPVTDWAHYNHGYTSAILNTPEVDPEAYTRSSPIEYAAGLTKPLLICHGMVDDNVFFQDSVRLVQRLMELEKDTFETAIYPFEPHGFREPTSWRDEYRRIFSLFERTLKAQG